MTRCRLHTTPDSSKWTNILLICGLLFSLPYSTGKLERFISSLKLTKTDRRTKLHFSTLNVAVHMTIVQPVNLSLKRKLLP